MNRLLFFLLFSISPFVNSQNIMGTVVDDTDGYPLKSVDITVKVKNIKTVSNKDGKFSLSKSLIHQNDSLQLTYSGYESLVFPINKIDNDTSFIIRLSPIFMNLPDVDVVPFNINKLLGKLKSTIAENKRNDPFKSTGLYRRLVIENDTVKQVMEATLSNFYNYKKNEFQFKSTNTKEFDKNTRIPSYYAGSFQSFIERQDVSFNLSSYLDKKKSKEYRYHLMKSSEFDATNTLTVEIRPKKTKNSGFDYIHVSFDPSNGVPVYLAVYYLSDSNVKSSVFTDFISKNDAISTDISFYKAGFKMIDKHLVMTHATQYRKAKSSLKSTGELINQTTITSFVNNDFDFNDATPFQDYSVFSSFTPIDENAFHEIDSWWDDISISELEKEFLSKPKK